MERALKEQNLQQLELELNAKLEHYTTVDTSSDDQTNTGSGVCVCVSALVNLSMLSPLFAPEQRESVCAS